MGPGANSYRRLCRARVPDSYADSVALGCQTAPLQDSAPLAAADAADPRGGCGGTDAERAAPRSPPPGSVLSVAASTRHTVDAAAIPRLRRRMKRLAVQQPRDRSHSSDAASGAAEEEDEDPLPFYMSKHAARKLSPEQREEQREERATGPPQTLSRPAQSSLSRRNTGG